MSAPVGQITRWRLLNALRQRRPADTDFPGGRGAGKDRKDGQRYSDTTTHVDDGERPKKRLSYIGCIWVAGQTNVPAAVARANTL